MPFPYLSKSSSSLPVSSRPSLGPRSQSRASGIFGAALTTILVGPSETAKEFKISKNILYNESSLLRERLAPARSPSPPSTTSSSPLSSNPSSSFSTPLTTTPSPADEINTIHLPSILPSTFTHLNYWFYTRTIPISATPSATHADVLSRLQLFSLAEFLGIASLEESLYSDLRWLSYHTLLRPSFPSTECLSYVFGTEDPGGKFGVKNKQIRHLLIRCFVYEFLRQRWRGDVHAIKKIAQADPEFRDLLTKEMGFFGAARRGHPFLDKDLEVFETRGRVGRVLLKKYGQLRDSKAGGAVEVEVGGDGMPGVRRRGSKRGGKKRLSGMSGVVMSAEVMGSRLGPGPARAVEGMGVGIKGGIGVVAVEVPMRRARVVVSL